MPIELTETQPLTPASSKASFAAYSAKVRRPLTLPLGIPDFPDRLLLTSRIRISPFFRRRHASVPDSRIGVPLTSGGAVAGDPIRSANNGEGPAFSEKTPTAIRWVAFLWRRHDARLGRRGDFSPLRIFASWARLAFWRRPEICPIFFGLFAVRHYAMHRHKEKAQGLQHLRRSTAGARRSAGH
jgi:hypothetical protein